MSKTWEERVQYAAETMPKEWAEDLAAALEAVDEAMGKDRDFAKTFCYRMMKLEFDLRGAVAKQKPTEAQMTELSAFLMQRIFETPVGITFDQERMYRCLHEFFYGKGNA